ncbi:CRISPR-associated RAMP protein [Candidatus Magnetomorum sp. HK-1]|nr:CRISPR-associated RAMP protein [Candidatus Magnetomorum sp. HK-1]
MKRYILEVLTKSPTISASGEGFGAVLDTDIVYDDMGLPFIPAKRIKGCLRDSAQQINEMLDQAGIIFPLDHEKTFGVTGSEKSAPVYFSNLTILDYKKIKKWLEYFMDENNYEGIVSREKILKTFTEIRKQTAIGHENIALKHSLRTTRAIKKGVKFSGNIYIEEDSTKNNDVCLNTLILACYNFRYMGTNRTRGFGEISCCLKKNDGTCLQISKELEERCMN